MREPAGAEAAKPPSTRDGAAPFAWGASSPNGKLATSPQGSFTYDDRGLVHTRTVASGTYTYGDDVAGRNTTLTYPDGHQRVQQYDAEGRITSRCYVDPSNQSRCYGAVYDAVGNPVQMTDPEGTDVIEYDDLDRVVRVTRSASGQADVVEQYTYNALGAVKTNAGAAIDDQRPLLNGAGTSDSAVPGTYGGQPVTLDNEGKVTSLAGLAVGYTQGAITSLGTAHLKYDSFFRITGNELVPGPVGPVQYTYDGANRSGIWSGGQRTDTWIYDGVDHPLEHFDKSGNRQYYELDLAGNVRRLRGPNGVDLGGYRYTAFGAQVVDGSAPEAPQGVNALPVRWKGRWLVYAANLGSANAVELYDVRARW